MTRTIADKKLLKFYRTMVTIRKAEERIAVVYRPEQQIRFPTHLCVGQEAIATGVCAALRSDDLALGYYRSHGYFLAKGGNLKKMMAELYGKATGTSHGKGGSMLLSDPSIGLLGSSAIVGGGIPIATGVALGIKLQNQDRVAVSFFGDAAIEEGVFHESMNFASLKKLPVIFVCENNFYAVRSHIRSRQPHETIYKRAEAYAMPGVRVDGNDVRAVFQATEEAVERARNGGGPTLIEALTYRWLEHVGPEEDKDYRPQEEKEHWKNQKCPVDNFKKILLKEGILSVEQNATIEKEVDREIEDAIRFAKESPFPDASEIYTDVY